MSRPQRIASLAPSHTELVFALGTGDRLVAATSFCNYPPEAERLPKLKGWANLKAEEVVALKPDLVLTSSVCQGELLAELQKAGLNVFHQDPRSLDEVTQCILELGVMLGRQDEAKHLAEQFYAGLRQIALSASPNGPRPRVYVEEWHQPPMAAGNWVPDLVRLAGGEPFLIAPGSLSREVSWEEVMEFDPQVVIYSICGLGLKRAPEEFLKVEGWDKTEAAEKKAVYSIDDDLFNRPSLRLIEGGKLLQRLIGEAHWGWDKIESSSLRRLP